MSKAKEAAEALKIEAKQLLNKMFRITKGTGDGTVERIVDCIVMAAMLEVAAVQVEVMKEAQGE